MEVCLTRQAMEVHRQLMQARRNDEDVQLRQAQDQARNARGMVEAGAETMDKMKIHEAWRFSPRKMVGWHDLTMETWWNMWI